MASTVFQFGKGVISSMIVGDSEVPQTEQESGAQARNSAGGFSFVLDDMSRVRRFLILGCEGGTYYTSERKLGLDNAKAISRLIASGRGTEVVAEVLDCARHNRAPKSQPLVFALAMCARSTHAETQKAAYAALPTVCRIPTTLFAFIEYSEALSVGTGWSRAHKRAIGEWFTSKSPAKLAYMMTKYKQRDGWSHQDVLRLAHIKPPSEEYDLVFRYAAKGYESLPEVPAFAEALAAPMEGRLEVDGDSDEVPECAINRLAEYLSVIEKSKTVENDHEMAYLIRNYGLVREHVPTTLLNSLAVWEALLEKMPMTAMIRNLGKMTSIGLVTAGSEFAAKVSATLRDESKLHRAHIHPFSILLALYTYNKGHGDKGSLKWEPVPEVCDALDAAFYLAFNNVEPANKRILVGMDVSGSMGGAMIQGTCISAREGAAALAMQFLRTERSTQVMAFCDQFVELDLNAGDKLSEVVQKISDLPFGATDCSLPMLWAMDHNVEVDCFVVITDNETYAGSVHPHVALQRYREHFNIAAKMIVVGMTATEFTIADPDDGGMLDVVGFDSSAPEVVRDFLLGRV